MIYIFAAYVVGSLAAIIYCVRVLLLSQRDHGLQMSGARADAANERQALQTQLLAMVADPQTAVTVAMSQGIKDDIKPVHYMDDAAMADYEENTERRVLQEALDRGDDDG